VFQERLENVLVKERGLSADRQTGRRANSGSILGLGYLNHHTLSEDKREAHV
jgi:hypothetical protein